MTIIGQDKAGRPIAVERGLIYSTLYRGHQVSGLGDVGEWDWEQFWTGINPIMQGVGARIAGRNQPPVVPVNPYQSVSASGPGFFGSMNPMYLILGAGALVLVLVMKR
jgi:hypothetical protein